mgnify:CR=1 FL=1
MVYVESPGKQETDEKFGRLWFASLARFHRVKDPLSWDFDETHVIEFLKSKDKERMPGGGCRGFDCGGNYRRGGGQDKSAGVRCNSSAEAHHAGQRSFV